MKKLLYMLMVSVILLCGCSGNGETPFFTKAENGNLVSPEGVEYAYLAMEGTLNYLGELEFVGGVQGEAPSSQHLGASYQTGVFVLENSESDNVLIRRTQDNEWYAIYRKASLAAFDFTVDNCVRLEYCRGGRVEESGTEAISFEEIAGFLSEIRAQKSPKEAGLYELVEKEDGTYENCYITGVIYGFFEEEPNLVVSMYVTSYNDLAYSVTIGEEEYVLPVSWFQRLSDGV